ncbi:unnamed protein product [Phytomonas sp. Hart1]|nr:unnamed protein product [Phytomonas sp. Hart1]|eukprot:CCW66771.1 unnamed protein product [Phytomonas sp. isolate Hart1]
MLPEKNEPLNNSVVPYSRNLHGPSSSSRALRPAFGDGNTNNMLVNFNSTTSNSAELPSSEPVVKFNYNFDCPRCLFKSVYSQDCSIIPDQDERNVDNHHLDNVLSTQHSPCNALGDDAGVMMPKAIPNVERRTFPCAQIRWAAELFCRRCRGYRPQDALTFPGFYALSGDRDLKNSPMEPETSHNYVRKGSDETIRTSNESMRTSFLFSGTGTTESDSELLDSRKDLKYKCDEVKSGDVGAMAITPRDVRASIIYEGFSGEFAHLLCQNSILLCEADEFYPPHAEGVTAAVKHVLSISESDLPKPISNLRNHPEGIHAALSSLIGVMHVMFFVLQTLDAVMRGLGNPKNIHSNLKQKLPATKGVRSRKKEASNPGPSSYIASVLSLREFAHALWLHLLGMWPTEVITMGIIEWWLHHPQNGNSDLGIESSGNQDKQQPQSKTERVFLSEHNATSLTNQIQSHVEQIFSAVVYRIHLMALPNTWCPVEIGEPPFQCGLISFSPNKNRKISYDNSSYDRRENECIHTKVREDFFPFRFPQPQRQASYQGWRQELRGSKCENKNDVLVQSSQSSFQSDYKHFSSDYSTLWKVESSPYQNALLAQLLIRFLSSCFVPNGESSQSNLHAINRSEDNRPSYLLFALCRLGNNIPTIILSHIEQLASSPPLSSSAMIMGTTTGQSSPFLQTLLIVLSEAMRLAAKLAAKLAARVGGVRLEMKTDLMCFIGRLLRLRELLVFRSLKSYAEFDAELKRLEALLSLAK